MENLTSDEWQQVIILLVDRSYQPFIVAYVSIWCWCIVAQIFKYM